MHSNLPAYCTALRDDALNLPLPAGSVLISTGYDSNRWRGDEFSLSAITPVTGAAKRQSEHLAGRLCAREALARLGCHEPVAVGTDRAPHWPAGFSGSISHGDGLAAAIVAPAEQWTGLGLDIERLLAPERAQKLKSQLLTEHELEALSGLDDAAQAMRISQTFSLKEALFKALYPLTQTRFYFEHAQVTHWSAGGVRLQLLTDLSPQWRRGCELGGQWVIQDARVLSLVAVAG